MQIYVSGSFSLSRERIQKMLPAIPSENIITLTQPFKEKTG